LLFVPLPRPAGEAEAQPQDRHGSVIPRKPRYNFPPPSRGDRFARNGLDIKEGIKGWRRFGRLIKVVARDEGVDPFVLGAYVWVESNFNPRQDFANATHHAVGLGSVQPADYHWRYTERQLMDPWLNMILTAREFKAKWRPHDMFGTVMDVWYPRWRRLGRGERIPVVRYPEVYVQAIANRYYALQEIDQHLVPSPRPKPKPRAKKRPEKPTRPFGAA
jgi:hypothetical protein